jgi:hypothetical protein
MCGTFFPNDYLLSEAMTVAELYIDISLARITVLLCRKCLVNLTCDIYELFISFQFFCMIDYNNRLTPYLCYVTAGVMYLS